MSIPEAIPHVYAGLESAWPSLSIEQAPDDQEETASKRQRKLSAKAEALQIKSTNVTVEAGKVPLLLIALFQNTISKMRDTEVSADEAEDIFGEVLTFLRDKDDDMAEAMYDENYADIALAIDTLGNSLQGLPFWNIWHENIPQWNHVSAEDTSRAYDDDDVLLPRAKTSKTPLRRKEKHASSTSDEDLLGAAGLLPGLGTMFQPAVDWLSDERQADYFIWEQGIRREMLTIAGKS